MTREGERIEKSDFQRPRVVSVLKNHIGEEIVGGLVVLGLLAYWGYRAWRARARRHELSLLDDKSLVGQPSVEKIGISRFLRGLRH